MVMEVFAGGDRITTSIVLQAAVLRGDYFFEALDSVTHISRQALAVTLVLARPERAITIRSEPHCEMEIC